MIHSQAARIRTMTLRALLFGLVAVAATGCGDKKGDKNDATVTGTVKFDGKPLTSGIVHFVSPEAEAAKTSGIAGQIESDGTYKIRSAPVGPVKIYLEPPTKSSDSSKKNEPVVQLPAKYLKVETSGLTYTVVAGPNTKDIDLPK